MLILVNGFFDSYASYSEDYKHFISSLPYWEFNHSVCFHLCEQLIYSALEKLPIVVNWLFYEGFQCTQLLCINHLSAR